MKVLICIGAFFALIFVVLCVSWFAIVTGRPMAKYNKETERQVYMNSVAHQEGANAGIGIDCANMRNVSLSMGDRHGYASLVISDAAGYSGDKGLSGEALGCVSEARQLLSQPIQ